MNDQEFKQLCQKVINFQGEPTLFLSFSGGKDSLATFLRCYETGLFKKYVLFYMYLVDDLSFVNEYLDYFSKNFDVEIIVVPSPQVLKMKHASLLQTPLRVAAYHKFVDEHWPIYCYSYKELETFIKEDRGLSLNVLTAVGSKESDSMMRRMALRKTGPISEKNLKWFPIHDLNNRQVAEIINRHGVRLPKDYRFWGLTHDGLDAKFSTYIKENLPEDWQKIKEVFPLADLILARRERYNPKPIKKARFNYETYNLKILE